MGRGGHVTSFPHTCARAHKKRMGLDGHPCPPCPPQPRPIAEVLETIAQRLRCLGPDHRDPHRFHEQKSEIVAELRRLARSAA